MIFPMEFGLKREQNSGTLKHVNIAGQVEYDASLTKHEKIHSDTDLRNIFLLCPLESNLLEKVI